MEEKMVRIMWPNGHVGACRETIAKRFVKKKQARYARDVENERAEAEEAAAKKAKEDEARSKAAANKSKDD